MSASLRSVIAQKEELLQAAAARERRLGEIARKLESRALSSHAQLTQLREAEGGRAAELQQLRGALQRAEAKAAALEEAVRLSPLIALYECPLMGLLIAHSLPSLVLSECHLECRSSVSSETH